ncbi:LacI family DNA-binding transcriptional regulator [Microbacterium sp. SLBN-146]|uniref:LacI family DNA-binding transcriptional regulator n=1 Tax=Microbacterium sp. SLBN-146 TaxID=2768457 RepID=UPI001153991C|nr:LacI family DNA-binding transcriptional regulator [Microbacterium sp. SLBN-146]TQJ30742.1 LacI family transcriptional regulator [Microbacterium sp. SLBN-146]
MKRATLRDVALASGVHVSTVSRILRGDSERVRPDTIVRVRAHADALGYSADRWAASLRSGRTNLIGMLVPRITDIVLATVFEAFEEEAARNGYLVLVASTWDAADRRAAALARFVSQRVDGIVIGDSRLNDDEVEDFARSGPPVLLISRRTADLPFVTGDDYGGGAQAGHHIADVGAKSARVIAGPDYASTSRDRVAGFSDAFLGRGDGRHVEVLPAGFDLDSGRRAMERVIEAGVPDAVFVVNDFAAIGAMSTLHRAGIVPGRDIAVVGYNDIPISAQLPVPLSSVRADLSAMGRTAFQSMRSLIDTKTTESVFVETKLVVRESSSLSPAR